MILSTAADRLTAFTARGRPRKAEAALRASNARNFRAIVSPPHLRPFRDSNIRRSTFSFDTERAQSVLRKRNFARAGNRN